MQKFQTINASQLAFLRPDINKFYYEITQNATVFGSLELISETGTLARIEVDNDVYMVKRKGFFKPYMTIRKQTLEKIESITILNITEKSALMVGETELSFRAHHIWKNQWAWVDSKNQVVMKYKPMVAANNRGEIEISKDFLYMEHLELFAMVGWYFLIMLELELENINELKIIK